MINRVLNIPRLLIEILVIIASVEAGIVFLLPVLAPQVSEVVGAMLDAGTLTLIAGPLICWRTMRAAAEASSPVPQTGGASTRPVLVMSVLIFLVCAAATGFMAARLRSETLRDAKFEFMRLADRQTAELTRRAELPLYGLRSVVGLYESSESVTRGEFESHVRSLDVPGSFPGVLGFG
ncbi:MAG: hypothetical protein WC718_00950 [Phycisphaerales bacterium]|jgi:hypothetical protein